MRTLTVIFMALFAMSSVALADPSTSEWEPKVWSDGEGGWSAGICYENSVDGQCQDSKKVGNYNSKSSASKAADDAADKANESGIKPNSPGQ